MQNKIPIDYVEKVYAGWLGKTIGVRHGSNIEGWDYDKIQAIYGEIDGYLFDFKNFAADDDTNGPYFFIRALNDYTHTRELTPQQIALTWLNYAPYEHGFYWWGGYGVSTEHTAYLNLRSGIEAPRSGSICQNGATVAEQIGGQIFIDSWGLVIPNDYRLAAEYAEKAASVSHGGNGIYGGMFVAACISAAFNHDNIEKVLECGFSVIPSDCEYYTMGKDVWAFYEKEKDNWRACFEFVKEKYGYQHYGGVCHIIPNAAVMILSMLYGKGDFSRTINICNMCGWDTDCNVGNVGTIMGVLCGLDGIDQAWTNPIGDLLICSSVIGALNILDLPGCVYYLAGLGYKIAGEEPPAEWKASIDRGERSYDFELPGSTHSFRMASDAQGGCTDLCLRNSRKEAFTGRGSLCASGKFYAPGDETDIYLQTYYRPSDFDDSRYDPSFSPLVYPGQTLACAVKLDSATECGARCCLYVLDDNSGAVYVGESQPLPVGQWTQMKWQIPSKPGACLSRAGVKLICADGANMRPKTFLAYVDDFVISGCPDYTVDFAKERVEQWNLLHREISQFTRLKGIWELEKGGLYGSCDNYGECYTGVPQWTDYTVSALLKPVVGSSHRLLFRVQGAIRSYAVGFEDNGKLTLFKNDNGYRGLAQTDFPWEANVDYTVKVTVRGNDIGVTVNDVEALNHRDADSPYLNGQVGFGIYNGSRCRFENLSVAPLK